MKRTIDGTIKQEPKEDFCYDAYNCNLSETTEILWCSWKELKKFQNLNMKYQAYNNGPVIDFELQNSTNENNQKLRVNFNNKDDKEQIYTMIFERTDNSNYETCSLKNNEYFDFEINNLGEQQIIEEGEDDEKNISAFFKQYLHDNFVIIFWKQGFEEEERLTFENTDCIIRSLNDEVPFCANANKLLSSSSGLNNMVKVLPNKNYNPENPLDLTEYFEEFHYQHIRMYLCCVYNNNFIPKQLIHIISILQICAKFNNQRVIKKILEMEELGKIVRDEIVMDDPQHPCYVQSVLQFANKHNLYKILAFCSLSLVDKSGEKTSRQMQELLKVYKKD